jgi:hypothetical protein
MEEANYAHLWWATLSVFSVMQIYYVLSKNNERVHFSKHPDPLNSLWNKRSVLMATYVFVCAFRSFLPRMDGDRSCFWDVPFLSSVILGYYFTYHVL